MNEVVTVLERLIEEGKAFQFSSATVRDPYGDVHSTTPAWTAWTTRVRNLIERTSEKRSAPHSLMMKAAGTRLIGNGSDTFRSTLEHYLAALGEARANVEQDLFNETASRREAVAQKSYSTKAFIVHGRDDASKDELSAIVAEMGLEPVVLHRQPDGGKTIVEKFEQYADVGYAFVILTPDEIAYLADQDGLPDGERRKEKRARPNVIFEFGYFIGRLGRARTCCIYRGDVVIPSDLNGLVYKRYERTIEEVAWSIRKDLKAAGYELPNL